MKIINLDRGQGKTTRLLYASEFNNIPILCATLQHKKFIEERARQLGLKIPEPICVANLIHYLEMRDEKLLNKDILIDEAPMVLQILLNNMGMRGEIKAVTLTVGEE